MITREQTIIIKSSPEEIWQLLSADKIPEWQPYMAKNKRREYVTPIECQTDKYKAGATLRFDGTCRFEVLESSKNKKLVYRISENSFLGKLGGRVIFIIESNEAGCKFTYRTEMDFTSKLVEKLIGNYFTLKWFEKQLSGNMVNLKNLLEKA